MVDPRQKVIVWNQGDNSHGQPCCRGDQCLRDSFCDHLGLGNLGKSEDIEGVDDTQNCAEDPKKGSYGDDRIEDVEIALHPFESLICPHFKSSRQGVVSVSNSVGEHSDNIISRPFPSLIGDIVCTSLGKLEYPKDKVPITPTSHAKPEDSALNNNGHRYNGTQEKGIHDRSPPRDEVKHGIFQQKSRSPKGNRINRL